MSDGDKGHDGRHRSSKQVRAELVEIRHRYFHRRYAILFYSLVITLGIGPLVAALDLDVSPLHLFIAFNLVALAIGAPFLALQRDLLQLCHAGDARLR